MPTFSKSSFFHMQPGPFGASGFGISFVKPRDLTRSSEIMSQGDFLNFSRLVIGLVTFGASGGASSEGCCAGPLVAGKSPGSPTGRPSSSEHADKSSAHAAAVTITARKFSGAPSGGRNAELASASVGPEPGPTSYFTLLGLALGFHFDRHIVQVVGTRREGFLQSRQAGGRSIT